MAVIAATDIVGAWRAYLNSLTGVGQLVGAGNPIVLGFWLGDGPRETSRPRGPYKGAFGVLSRIGGAPNPLDEAPWDYPRVSASLYGVTTLQADTAALAYVNTLLSLDGTPVRVTWTPDDAVARVATLLSVESISGPLEIPGPEPRRLVDAVITCTPA
ncbi:MAG TPA: hypothetical protein VJX66_32050 [Amycolatopsis sp.]|nr:hypothetical protein [Amycolatopsis sp.]